MTLYLTRARLHREAPINALRQMLVPRQDGARVAAAHRIIWAMFADSSERTRDFLWREIEPGTFMTLSERRPPAEHAFLRIDEPKEFCPTLVPGDRLNFLLRANATVARKMDGNRRGTPCDVVMNALYDVPKSERAEYRTDAIEAAGTSWLKRQGTAAGFSIDGDGNCVSVTSYKVLRFPHRAGGMRVGVLDFEGTLSVDDPQRFLAALKRGFGRAKAYGCGLMLIRRAG